MRGVAAINYMRNSDGLSPVDADRPLASYLAVFLIALDAVIPIFPGETTLNAASTVAAQGKLDLGPIIVMGALGAIVGDSCLFWLARKWSGRIEPQLDRSKSNDKVRQAFALLDSSAPVLIIGGRYVPGMRFVVNATMGLSDHRLPALPGLVGHQRHAVERLHLRAGLPDRPGPGRLPLASFVISGLVTTVALAVVFFTVRRQRRRAAAPAETRRGCPAWQRAMEGPWDSARLRITSDGGSGAATAFVRCR